MCYLIDAIDDMQVAEIYSEVIREHFPGCFAEIVFAIPSRLRSEFDEFHGVICGYSAVTSADVLIGVTPPAAERSFHPLSLAIAGESSSFRDSPSPRAAATATAAGTSGHRSPVRAAVPVRSLNTVHL